MGSWIFILFYGFKFIAIIIYFDAQIVPDLAGETPFELIPVSFWRDSIILWVLPSFMM